MQVCSACCLRGSCDRAYVTLKESEQDARTVDLVRLLLFYALDPLVISGALGSRQVDHVNSSARKLLRKLTDLSEASPALAPLQPSVKDSYQKKQIVPSKDAVMAQNIETNKGSKNAAMTQNVEMKKADWVCPQCSFVNFSRNVQCRKCHAGNPKGVNSRQVEMKAGDWNCPKCSFMNFSRNVRCRKCHAENPKGQNSRQVEMKTGDWNCPQ
ncbi:hypothetical protein Cgig2_015380 [Carnegiea gigantea]|uniref:RanBP2-type domain-containing protein n=1 Tax=Carnegiea gigantea TaxID=171969 RepID=A0A9Q1JST6_9CARY|nr:hypothetical protein Cgig2_015380 [Carnegiea gigantea]